ncbi:cell division protein ZapA [Facklamia sp. 7083-14-GEN3]|uniref:cell division protein ZapA n=1 Tax=Facklamia sp. 7083-14-GEN3 TaxID=2973478 RepID=UPI00215C7E2A|nr:cell division protein ZapA [Facklamia sp. 7083-14-GEN3]MCR8968651.1 cell division protein ZapA [Facklamia sp. 7083-14-GEN3]
MEEKNRYKALIEGRVYTIVGHRSREHMDAVVQLLTQQLQQLKELDPNLTQEDRAILMAINAISDQITKEEKISVLEKKLGLG